MADTAPPDIWQLYKPLYPMVFRILDLMRAKGRNVDVPNIRRGLHPDALRDDDLDVVEPLSGSKPRSAASLRILEMLVGPGVVEHLQDAHLFLPWAMRPTLVQF